MSASPELLFIFLLADLKRNGHKASLLVADMVATRHDSCFTGLDNTRRVLELDCDVFELLTVVGDRSSWGSRVRSVCAAQFQSLANDSAGIYQNYLGTSDGPKYHHHTVGCTGGNAGHPSIWGEVVALNHDSANVGIECTWACTRTHFVSICRNPEEFESGIEAHEDTILARWRTLYQADVWCWLQLG